MPSVLVSTPLMKKRATLAPKGAISAATCGVLRFSESTMRSRCRCGRRRWWLRSRRSGARCRASSCATSRHRAAARRARPRPCEVAGKVPTSNGTPLMKLVAVEVKNSCCRPGARKPVDTAPRSANDVGEVVARGDLAGDRASRSPNSPRRARRPMRGTSRVSCASRST